MKVFIEINVLETVPEEIKKEGDPSFRVVFEATRTKVLGGKSYEEAYKDSAKSFIELKPGKKLVEVRVINIPEGRKVATYYRIINERK